MNSLFKKYPSLVNHYQSEQIEAALNKWPCLNNTLWLVQEKLHGANLQVIITSAGIVCASRNQILQEGDNFYSYKTAVNNNKLIKWFKSLADSNNKTYHVYGELVGPGIQKGVDYGTHKRFYVFDVLENGVQLPPNDYPIGMMDSVAPILGVTSLKTALSTNVESLITKINPKSGNYVEGVVLKPLYPDHTIPFRIKYKSEKFKERAKEPKKHKPNVSSSIMVASAIYQEYINGARVDSYESKSGPIRQCKDIPLYIKGVLEDAKVDFLADNPNALDAMTPAEVRQVFNAGAIVAKELIKRIRGRA